MFIFLFACFCYSLVDFEKIKASKEEGEQPIFSILSINLPKKDYNMTGSLLKVQNPIGFYHIYPPKGGCSNREKTSQSSLDHDCEIGTNAGFFIMKEVENYCIGDIISDGEVIQYGSEKGSALSSFKNDRPNVFLESKIDVTPTVDFGLTKDGYFVSGFLEKETIQSLDFDQLVSGAVWLVRNGNLYVNKSAQIEHVSDAFVLEAAPREAIGVDKDGNLLILSINGNEILKQGPDLFTFARLMRQYGALHAVNLDGGGSTTVVVNDKIISKCMDPCTPSELSQHCPNGLGYCERKVTTINCISKVKK